MFVRPVLGVDQTSWVAAHDAAGDLFAGAVVLVSPAIPHQEIAVMDAAAHARVTHVIKATSKASADSRVDRRRGQNQIEQHLQASSLAWTLLRSNAYLQNLLTLAPIVKQTSGFGMSTGDGQVGRVDARDVAAVAATVAASPADYAGATYRPTGPALLTYTDVANELSAALGHPIEYWRICPDEHREIMIRAGLAITRRDIQCPSLRTHSRR